MWTPQDLQLRCDYWLNTLQMGEWKGRTKVLIKTPKWLLTNLEPSCVREGGCWWSAEECKAEIYLLRKATEETLLHEIVHLLFQGHTTYSAYDELMERSINRLVSAMVRTEQGSATSAPA